MKKLATVIDEITAAVQQERTKAAADSLSNTNTSPTISTELGLALLKTAALLKEAKTEISSEDLRKFMETLRNA